MTSLNTFLPPLAIIIPKLFVKIQYCIACAIHLKVVRVRSRVDRRSRAPPKRVRMRRDDQKKKQTE